jgi:hypothetical protein
MLKAKASQFVMVDIGVSQDTDIVIAALMLDVAVVAAAGIGQVAMQTREAGALLGNIHVAILALCR